MEIEKLIEALGDLEMCSYGYHINGEVLGMDCTDFECLMADAAEEISKIPALQAENDRLKEEVQQMQWIPVEERLPEEEGSYIVCVDGEVKWDAYCRFGRKERWLCYDGRLNALYIDPYSSEPTREPPYPMVTHWISLPEAPKEENKDD